MKILYFSPIVVLCSLLFVNEGTAQYSVSPSFSVLKGANGNKPFLIGGGLQVGYNLTSHIQLGVAYSLYAAESRERQFNSTFKANYKDQASNVAGTAAYLFLDSSSTFRPLLGLDAGVNFAKQRISFYDFYTGNRAFDKSVHNILLSPKAGVVIRINKWFNVIPQVQYHLSVQKKKEDIIGATVTGESIKLSPIQNFYTASAALSVRF